MHEPISIFSVSELNQLSKSLLEDGIGEIYVTGEISNLAQPSSGHCYFSLKDSGAQVRCALFRMTRMRLTHDIENGMQVTVRAKVSLYEARGDYQLIVNHLEPAGIGALQRAFEKLKNKLKNKGYFDESIKKALPDQPRVIGVIASKTSAALQDILKVLRRRAPDIPVIIYHTAVQGDKAAAEIVAAIKQANAHQQCDVLILARGGGSLEDLWPFNEEIVAEAIHAGSIPLVSGVGHEVDTTIADLVADCRAPTPSAAAELVCPNQALRLAQLQHYLQRLTQLMQHKIQQQHIRLLQLAKRLIDPRAKLLEYVQQVDQLEIRLKTAMSHALTAKQRKLQHLGSLLHALSPLQTMQRGYSIVFDEQGKIVRRAAQVKPKARLRIKLSDGELDCISG